jgi:hypothetical protein
LLYDVGRAVQYSLYCIDIFIKHREAYIRANFDVTIGRGACEACTATRNLGTNSAFALGLRRTKEHLDLFGRSQDLPDAN